jgi:hypothetical protein
MPWPTELMAAKMKRDQRRQQAVFDRGGAVLVGGEAANTERPS